MTANDDRLAQLLDLAIDTRDRVASLSARVDVIEARAAWVARRWALAGAIVSALVGLGASQCEGKRSDVPRPLPPSVTSVR